MVLACHPEHSLPRHKRIKAEQLSGQTYVGFDRDLIIRRRVDKFLRDQGILVDLVLEFDNIENIKKAIEEGAGGALLPLPTLEREVRAGSLVAPELTRSKLVRPLGSIQRRHVKTSPTAEHFIQLLQKSENITGSRTKVWVGRTGMPSLSNISVKDELIKWDARNEG